MADLIIRFGAVLDQIQLDSSYFRRHLQHKTGQTWKMQAVQTVRVEHGVVKFFEQVGQNQHVQEYVVSSIVTQHVHGQTLPHF